MCGIAGIINFKNAEEKLDLLRSMIGALRHRGPDAAGVYLNGPAGLGHARLSIIDLSSGNQPIHNEDGTIWVVYNGEIFNYPELREALERAGHRFYTRTDTEVLVHLYEMCGLGMLSKLNGQFAFAIWDSQRAQLLMARDRVGILPLFYIHGNRRLVFASEVKALFTDPAIARRLDRQTLSDVFTCWSPVDAATAFEGVCQLPPAHYAMFSEQGLTVDAYWNIEPQESSAFDRPLSEWEEEFSALLLDATRIRLRADVPVGAYLSGGIDSTYTCSVVKKHFDNRLCTFSVAFENEMFDEAFYQQTAIQALGTDHRTIRCSDADIAADFPTVVWHAESPLLRTAPAPLFRLSKLVRDNQYKVVLTGEGADEFFAGYNIFKETMVRRFWARNPDSDQRPKLLESLYPYVFKGKSEKAKSYVKSFFGRGLERFETPTFSHQLRWQNTSQLKAFFSKSLAETTPSLDDFIARFEAQLPNGFNRWKPLTKAQYLEVKLFLANYLLSSQGDRMIMAHSVEGRYPFLDPRVIDFAFRLPACYRLYGLSEKFILKRAARKVVPDAILTRPKQPYRAPISTVFLGKSPPEYVMEFLSESSLQTKGYFDPQRVNNLLKKARSAPQGLASERENMALVGILSTQLLDEMYVRNFQAPPKIDAAKLEIMGQDQRI
jgi:asparagine synthase (glutamine-hydrolysing)